MICARTSVIKNLTTGLTNRFSYNTFLKQVFPNKNIYLAEYTQNFFIQKSNYSSKTLLNYSPKICIVGSGPAALYSAQYVLKNFNNSNVSIDIYEKLPVPFGLVRYGVAPDHQDVKNVINSFTETLRNKNVNFFGNVNIGVDVRINELLNAYNCVVLAYGSLSENYLNIPGEKSFKNFVSAKDFVSWYNGLPQSDKFEIDLTGKKAIIIGAGNVSIDIARILLSPIEKLEKTDISEKAIDLFKKSNNIEEVSIVARRGVLNAAFTLKELRELNKLESVSCRIDLDQFKQINIEKILSKLARPRKRITEFMYNLAKQAHADLQPTETTKKKILNLIFLSTPTEILGGNPKDPNQVSGVKFKHNAYNVDFTSPDLNLDNEDALNGLSVIQKPGVEPQILNADLVVRSIGFKNVNIDNDVPFDKKLGIVQNDKGKVIGKDGLYCTGWIKRGPRGVIVDTTTDALETAQKLCNDLTESNNQINPKEGAENIVNLLNSRQVKFVDKNGWDKIDQEEIRRGKLVGKPREKLNTIDEMLQAAFSPDK